MSKINYTKLDHLDRELYELFLKVKSKFNKYAPISKDLKVMMIIAKTVNVLLEKFALDAEENNDENILQLIKRIKRILNVWLDDHSIHYLINSNPSNLGQIADFQDSVDKKDFEKSLTPFWEDPVLSSNLIPNIGVSAAKITKNIK